MEETSYISNATGRYVEQCLGKDGRCWEYASVLTALWKQKVVSIQIVLVHLYWTQGQTLVWNRPTPFGADCREMVWKLSEALVRILLRSLYEHFGALHCKGSYVYVPEILNYDKIEDSVLDITLIVTDQHLARDMETRGRQCCRLVNQGWIADRVGQERDKVLSIAQRRSRFLLLILLFVVRTS